MNTANESSTSSPAFPRSRDAAMWTRVDQAVNALQALTSGKVDAVMDPSGKACLLNPVRKENEELLQAVIESAADVITVVNRGGRFVSLSHAVSRVLGCEAENLVGKSIFEFVHKEDRHALYFAFFEVIEGLRISATVCFRHRARDGSWRIIEASVGKLRDDSSPRAVFSFRPHWSRFCKTGDGENTHELTVGGARVDRRLRLESVDAHKVVNSVMELCQSEIAAARVEVLLDLDAVKNIVQADWARLLQVICILVRNAIEFSAPGTVITIISANDALGRWTFELEDQGVGTKALFFPRVFEPSGPARRRDDDGFRHDLDIARWVAESLGGTLLTAAGNGKNKGERFLLTLNTATPPDGVPVIVLPEVPRATSPSA